MRRLMLVALAVVVVGGLTATVYADQAEPNSKGEARSIDAVAKRRLDGLAKSISGLRTAASTVTIQAPRCVPVSIQQYASCLNKGLKRLTTNLNRTLNRVDKALDRAAKALDFVQFEVSCLGFVAPISQYGDATAGTFGYVWNPGGGQPEFLTTAVDYLETDPAATPTEEFDWVQLVKDECVA